MEKGRIPNRLKKYRRWAGLSQRTVADELGVTPSCISRWERGLDFPGIRLFHLSILYRTLPNHLYFDYLETLKREFVSKHLQQPEPVLISPHEHYRL